MCHLERYYSCAARAAIVCGESWLEIAINLALHTRKLALRSYRE